MKGNPGMEKSFDFEKKKDAINRVPTSQDGFLVCSLPQFIAKG